MSDYIRFYPNVGCADYVSASGKATPLVRKTDELGEYIDIRQSWDSTPVACNLTLTEVELVGYMIGVQGGVKVMAVAS